MSVITAADEKLEEAKQHIQAALLALNEVVVGQCWGHDDYSAEYEEKIHRTYQDLLAMRNRLGSPDERL